MSKEQFPIVTIVIPVYNGSNYLKEAIDSALAQTYKNVEVLVVNDGSNDNGETEAIAVSYGNKIRYLKKENGGVVSALNYGIEQMRGEYFSWLSHDDYFLPEKIEKQMKALEKHSSDRLAFCVCNCKFIDENGVYLPETILSQEMPFHKPKSFLFLENIGFNGIMVLIPKKLFDLYGVFEYSLATHEYDMWLRLMEKADLVVEPEALSVMRFHSNQVSVNRKKDVILEIDTFMCSGIASISNEEFEETITDKIRKSGPRSIIELINGYLFFQKTFCTSEEIIRRLMIFMAQTTPEMDDVYKALIGHESIETFKSVVLSRQQNSKPLTVIYCETLTTEVFNEIALSLAILKAESDVAVLYHANEGVNLEELEKIDLIPLRVAVKGDYLTAVRTAMLFKLLNGNLFWHYAQNINEDFESLYYFELLKIRTIITFNDINSLTTSSEALTTQVENYLNTSVIATRIQPTEYTLSLFKNVIYIPEENVTALVKLHMLFNTLLNNANCEKFYEEAYSALASYSEKQEEITIGHILSYMCEFVQEVDQKSILMIQEYEQRSFWKLTKPCRQFVTFARKLKKLLDRILRKELTIKTIIMHLYKKLRNGRVSI